MTLKEQINWCKSQIKLHKTLPHDENSEKLIPLVSILNRLRSLEKPKQLPHQYHNQSVSAYLTFLQNNGLPAIIDARQAKALKELLPKLQGLTTSKSPEGAYNGLLYIFNGWDRLSQYHKGKKTLVHINNNIIEILDQIRYGADKKQDNRNQAKQLANQISQKQHNRP